MTKAETKPYTQNTDLNPPIMDEQGRMNAEEIEQVRAVAKEMIDKLGQEMVGELPNSWIQGEKVSDTASQRCRFFHHNGFLHLKGFASPTEVQALKQQMADLAENWDPAKELDTFATNSKSNVARGDYFLESASKVHFFAEPQALTSSTNPQLKPEYQHDKLRALNKAGHAMHMIPGAFRDYTLSNKVKDLVLELGWRDPVVPQSMYIFKQPRIGGPVTSHQDSTFLYTTPKQTCLGLWLALDPATLENGCLWVRPKSHWEATRRQYKRNVDHMSPQSIQERSNLVQGDESLPKFLMEDLCSSSPLAWEGTLPSKPHQPTHQSLLDVQFVPFECEPGDLLVFVGELDHLSLANFSEKQRHTFQLHLVEGPKAGVTWSPYNWLQYPKDTPFLSLVQQ